MAYEGKNQAVQLKCQWYGEVIVDQDDVIFRHEQDKYNHIRVHSSNDIGAIAIHLCFYSNDSLDVIAEHGVPEAYISEPTPTTVQIYEQDVVDRLEFQFIEEDE